MLRSIVVAILFVLVATATWVGWHPIALPESRSLHTQDDDWSLPNHGKTDTAEMVATIERDKLWGAQGTVASYAQEDKPLTSPNWSIVGVIANGKESYAMVSTEGQPMQQFKVGDKLPGGVKIVSMTADRICILLNGKKRVLRTYKE